MAGHGADISWDLLRQIVQAWAGTSAELKEVATLEGGMVNTTVALTLADGCKAVLKLTPHRVDRAHADEAIQLELLRSEEHTSELQSHVNLVCRLLLEKTNH